MKPDGSDEDSDEENEEGDYTVYECPGLAPVSLLVHVIKAWVTLLTASHATLTLMV